MDFIHRELCDYLAPATIERRAAATAAGRITREGRVVKDLAILDVPVRLSPDGLATVFPLFPSLSQNGPRRQRFVSAGQMRARF